MSLKTLAYLYLYVAIITGLFLAGVISDGLWLAIGLPPVFIGIIIVIADYAESLATMYHDQGNSKND